MELIHFEKLTDTQLRTQLQALLVLADKEFIPPLSSRGSTTQASLAPGAVSEGAKAYFDVMITQPIVVAVEEGRLAGFMSFTEKYDGDVIPAACTPYLYISTSIVHPDFRGRGLMRAFYRAVMAHYPRHHLFLRTWSTNENHLHILETLGFATHKILKDHRAPGIDTIYFRFSPQ